MAGDYMLEKIINILSIAENDVHKNYETFYSVV